MNIKIINKAATVAAIVSLVALPVFAETATSTVRGARAGAATAQRVTALQNKGDKEIDSRVASLNALITRIQGLKNVNDAQKAAIVAKLQSLVTDLTTLKAKIGSDTSTTTAKADTDAVTQDYRIYALAIPQLNILAASDRSMTIVAMMATIEGKLQARLSQASGIANLSTLQANIADMNAKLTDASTQAQNAVTEVSPLVPDQGDKTVMASNTATLKDARSKIQAATKDLTAARKDIQTIIQALAKYEKTAPKTKAPVSTGTTTSTTTAQ